MVVIKIGGRNRGIFNIFYYRFIENYWVLFIDIYLGEVICMFFLFYLVKFRMVYIVWNFMKIFFLLKCYDGFYILGWLIYCERGKIKFILNKFVN